MSEFTKILNNTLEHEGLYSNDPDDFGGETYKGIARNKHPSWPGWKIMDSYGPFKEFPPELEDKLSHVVRKFYRLKFWDEIMGDKIPPLELAQELFDTAVNMGIHWAALFLQKSLNLLNRNELLFSELVEDGIIGPKTLHGLTAFLQQDDSKILIFWMNIFQGMRYIKLMRKNSSQEKFARGWAKRVKLSME